MLDPCMEPFTCTNKDIKNDTRVCISLAHRSLKTDANPSPRVVASSLRPRRAEQGSAVSFASLSGKGEGRPAVVDLPFTNTHTQTPPPTHTRKGGGMEIHVRSRLGLMPL